jgi:CRP/FNR family transcriptional regulator, cyclic AMP receptor protein
MARDEDQNDLPLDQQAARLLITPSALEVLSLDDAIQVVSYMQLRLVPEGTVMMREGETEGSDHMLLVLEGDLTVESRSLHDEEDMVVRIMGPGSLIGELGLLDGAPRSASCVANTDMAVAVLTRTDFLRLIQDEPRVGARLLLAVSKRIADLLREVTHKLKLFAQMNKVLSQELATSNPKGASAGASHTAPG